MAARVELCTTILVGGLERDDFVANEVISARDTLRDCVLDGSAWFLESIRGPDIRGTLTTFFLDLKPDSSARSVSMDIYAW